MNAYERRKRILRIKRDLRQEEKRLKMLEHQDQVMLRFEIAYKDVYGYYPRLVYQHGWYVLAGGLGRKVRRFREQDLIFEANRLWATKHSEELGGLDE